ncbi:hypothetical protein ONS95_006479 [Cadophora gregata]|uniref:uncharacterized protein n=1 Tax=Cadophora gregata TaxID=51156 RepID=UPI0026DB896E|nr:uncharacterized protein ONS95_006479 [Cadophora gregata]KAK0101302.1 hypothetical protein ONS95_006479 [Cadophora gregata]KAK0106688.1 hypothetical protein ONS96_004307 [Cadophora gregata f. sp. sojae]
MFTRDHSEAKSVLPSEMFRDESKKSSSSYKSSTPKTEIVRKVVEEETYTDEPDFSKFVSTYSEPVKEKKIEKKPAEKKKEEKKKESTRKENPKKESKKPKSPVVESGRYVSRPISSAFAAKTAFKSTYDISMAEKQTKIAQLKGKELVEQEKWAQEKLKAHAGTCPMGFNWARFKQNAMPGQIELEGYRCLGGSHIVTHELLAKGTGDIYMTTEQYSNHLLQIRYQQIPVNAPFFGGQRWHGPVPSSDMAKVIADYESKLQALALQLVLAVHGPFVDPALIPQLQKQVVDERKQKFKERDDLAEQFIKRPGSRGGPWWEDCS